MEHRITAGVEVEHAGTRWRIERPLGADAELLRNDAGEIVSASPSTLRFPPDLPGQPAARRVDELQYTDAEWAEHPTVAAVRAERAGTRTWTPSDVGPAQGRSSCRHARRRTPAAADRDLRNIRGSGMAGMLVELREIGSVTGVSIGAFATKEIAHVFRLDEQLAKRFALLTLPRWQFDDLEYAQLLATFERQPPLRRPSNLTDPALARRILTMAGGLIGGIATVLRQAAMPAIEQGHERIDRSVLDRLVVATPEQAEAVATAPDL